jgi:hypothetical protein
MLNIEDASSRPLYAQSLFRFLLRGKRTVTRNAALLRGYLSH